MGKAEDKRAAIIAQQAAREQATPRATPAKDARGKARTKWAAAGPGRPGRGRPPKPENPPEES